MVQPTDRRIRTVLRVSTQRLRTCLADAPAGSGETPYLDALVLLAHALGVSTEHLFAALEDPLDDDVLAEYQRLVAERCDGMPVSYLRGVKEFYGREFAVGPGVLVPRPETELLVETALLLIDRWGRPLHVHDCCTGSGCVAVTLACERPRISATGSDISVTGSDISADALQYARRNAGVHTPHLIGAFWQGDLLAPLCSRVRDGRIATPGIITANPPYLADNEVEALTLKGWPEPRAALAAGPQGLDVIARLAGEAVTCLADGGYLIVEIGAGQGPAAARILKATGFADVEIHLDLVGRDRVCTGRWSRA